MSKYIVKVNGAAYEIEVEEVTGAAAAAPVAAAPVAAPAPAPAAGGQTISAPMPGTILDVKVKAGDAVKSGQVLFILEAMKMENEIMAPADGTIASVSATKGATVNAGDALCVLG